MKKYDLIDGDGNNANSEKIVLNTHEDLKNLLSKLDIHAESEQRYQNLYVVKHMKNIGGAQYIANAHQHFELLRKLAEKVESKEAYALYYIRLTGQEVNA